MSHQEQEEFNQQLRRDLLEHGFKALTPPHYRYTSNQGEVDVEIFENDTPQVDIHSKEGVILICWNWNHPFPYLQEQAKFYLGIDLVKKEEKEPLKCTLENALKGAEKVYWVAASNYIDTTGYLDKDKIYHGDGNEVINRKDADKLLLIPELMNLLDYANRQFPAEGGQQTRYFSPFFRFRRGLYQLYYSTTETPTHPFVFTSQKAFYFFSAEPENVELFKKVLTPNF